MTPSAPAPTYELVATSRLQPHSGNIRFDVGDVDSLAASITEKGIQQPLLVAPSTTAKTKFQIIDGHRRHAAAVQAGVKQIPVLIDTTLVDEASQVEAMLVAATHREDLTPVEEAAAYQRLLDYPGYDVKTLATRTGHTQAFVRGRLKIGRLPGRIKSEIHQGQITLEQAEVYAEFDGDENATKRLDDHLHTSNWSWTVADLRKARATLHRLDRRVTALRNAGVPVYQSWDAAMLAGRQRDRADQSTLNADWFTDDDNLVDEVLLDTICDLGSIAWDVAATFELHQPEGDDTHGLAVAFAIVGDLGRRTGIFFVVVDPSDDADGDEESGTARATEDADLPGDAPTPPAPPENPLKATAPKQTKEQREAAARDRELRSQLETAADVRWGHVLDVAAGGDEDLAAQVLRPALATWLSDGRPTVASVRQRMGLPDDATTIEEITAAISTWSLGRLVLADRAARELGHTDGQLLHPDRWPAAPTFRGYDYAADWRTELATVWGYEWSDVELFLLGDQGE